MGLNTFLSTDPDLLTIEEISLRVAEIYRNVTYARDPMFRWVQIVNDVTILGEEVRRNEVSRALDRAGKVLMRLLDFIGYHLSIHEIAEGRESFADAVALALRAPSYLDYLDDGAPREGLSRWIYVKYPHACSKCGQSPCHCVVTPWVFEDRRENPGPYEELRDRANDARTQLRETVTREFTPAKLVDFFVKIYRNQYYNQEPWKVAMHLTEELGEATIELSRLQVLREYELSGQSVEGPILEKMMNEAHARVHATLGSDSKKAQERADANLTRISTAISGDQPFSVLYGMIGEKLKEELADVASWFAAVVYNLESRSYEDAVSEMVKRYVDKTGSGYRFRCAWCHNEHCSDDCLVTNNFAGEVVEHALKF